MAGGAKKKQPTRRSRKVVVKVPKPVVRVKPQPPREQIVNRRRRSKTPMMVTDGPDYSRNEDFVKLVLDPCYGPLTKSPFGTTEKSYIWRLNYRLTYSANSAGNLMVALFGNGIYNVGSSTLPQCIQIWNSASLADGVTGTIASGNSSIAGSNQLSSLAAQVKITAGCISLKYIGPANTAAGEYYGWEGQSDEVFTLNGSTSLVMAQSAQGFALNGSVFPITSGVESRLNFATAPVVQQQYGDPAVGNSTVYCPSAVCGVSNGAPSGLYVIEATVVVEWVPKLSNGIPAPAPKMFKPGSADMVANAIKSVAPMLVSGGKVFLGGYASAFGSAVKYGTKVAKALMA